MKLIVGLGNPGRDYADSRHNIGFMVVKALAKAHDISFKKVFGIAAFEGRAKIRGQFVLLAMPLSFMNLSGSAVRSLVKRHKINLEDLLVVCDDLDLEFARLKIRPSGSSGGHNGLKSIIDNLEAQDFARLRIGIGRPHTAVDAADFVLAPFAKKEKEEIKETIARAQECCETWVTKGITESMNLFNQKGRA